MVRKIVPLVLALTTLLAACGGSDPVELISAANAATTEGGTARMYLQTSVSGLGAGADLTTTGEGVVDFENQRGKLTMQLPSLGGSSLGDLELVYDGTVLYYQASSFFPDAPTPWVSFDIARVSEELTGTDLSQLSQGGGNDPSNSLALLQGVSDDVKEVGTEEVRGVETTHYRATVDIQRAIEAQGAVADREQFESFLEQFATEPIPVDVWLDDEGRAVRTRYDQPLPETPGTPIPPGARVGLTIELYDFGVDEPIEIPPSQDVTDITDIGVGAAEDLNNSTTSTTI